MTPIDTSPESVADVARTIELLSRHYRNIGMEAAAWTLKSLPSLLRALVAERDALRADAELGRVALQFVDRAGDVCEQDPAERICEEFAIAMSAAIELERRKSVPGYAAVIDQARGGK